MFFEFNQNNSGGVFHIDDNVCHRLFIEAETADEANIKAISLGVYFDGCDIGVDCSCCGDRWHEAWTGEGIDFPLKYSKETVFEDVESYAQYLANTYGWTVPDIRIFYSGGRVKDIYTEDK